MKAKVLIIDDEPDAVELLKFNLGERGYEVLTAADGLTGLNEARRHLPDLILLDLTMAGLDGFAVCDMLRRQPSTANAVIIVHSGRKDELSRSRALASGADEFLTKPCSPRRLAARVEAALELSLARMCAGTLESD